ncbi:MAG: phosphonopyruvate decarboxylase [Methanomassiliicoccales archaeon]
MFYELSGHGIDFFTGVPDSLLKDLCAYITDNAAPGRHVIAANEGNAIAMGTGWYLGTGRPALVYMQNSGIGNAVNPLTSLADREVYGIPMLLLIGWRGEPGRRDEPQHMKKGRITPDVLEALEIPWYSLGGDSDYREIVGEALEAMERGPGPVAILVRKGAFEKYELRDEIEEFIEMDREEAIRRVVSALGPEDIIVSTTGKTSRELYELREERGEGHGRDFLTVGSMGHASSIAAGLARSRPEREVICLDGDGSTLMHMGSMAIIGNGGLDNLLHVVINNASHDSVGGQPTVGFQVDFPTIAKACGYREALRVEGDEIEGAVSRLRGAGPAFLEIRVRKGAREDLGRPRSSPSEIKRELMRGLGIDI